VILKLFISPAVSVIRESDIRVFSTDNNPFPAPSVIEDSPTIETGKLIEY